MRVLIVTLMLVYGSVAGAQAPDTENDVADITAVRTHPVPIKRKPPRYPQKALRQGTEGWVVTRFTITAEGTTDDIVVVHASIDGVFEKEAIRAIKDWTYEPGTLNGVAVRQNTRAVRQIFRVKNQKIAVTREFQEYYKRATAAVKNGELETAKELIDQLDANQRRLLTEVCYLDVLKSAYWQKMGNDKAKLRHVERALVIADEVATKGMYTSLLRQAIIANAQATKYAAVLKHYKTLLGIQPDLPPDDPVRKVVSRVEALLEGDKPIATGGKIIRCKKCQVPQSYWRRTLSRSRFSVDEVVGRVNEIEVVCDRQSVTLAYDPDTVWSVEQGWGECDIRVHGDDGTTFRLVEHPQGQQ